MNPLTFGCPLTLQIVERWRKVGEEEKEKVRKGMGGGGKGKGKGKTRTVNKFADARFSPFCSTSSWLRRTRKGTTMS